MMQKELEDRDDNIKKKEKKIYEYKYKINDLQKSKHVLSFRTTEMRKSLEPKEAQIEKLKEELFNLEREFEAMLKTSQVQNEKLLKKDEKIKIMTNNIKELSETIKKRENLINQIVMDIHDCVKSKDQKEWVSEMKTLYQNYVIPQEVKQSGHDPRGVEEMGRQISHLEKSINQMNKSNDKLMKRREHDIFKKTLENSELINDLNKLRQQNTVLQRQMNTMISDLKKYERENSYMKNEMQRLKSQLSKFTVHELWLLFIT
jgi:chromosome segregation ATPase